MTDAVDKYMDRFEGEKKEWLTTMVEFTRNTFPELEERMFYGMPAFRFDGGYIAFSVAKDHFTFHTLDFDMVEELKARLPKAGFGRGSVKVKFADREAIPVLFEASKTIVNRWKERGAQQPRVSERERP